MSLRLPVGLSMVCAVAAVRAADVPTPPTTGATSTLLQVVFGLAVVLLVIAGAAWLARRYLPAAGAGGGPARIVGGVMVGPKERVVVVEVADTWIVAGVTSQNVNALCTMPRPPQDRPDASGIVPADRNFSTWLAKALKGQGH
jgi:flagellar protein FliO/FliZ